jgi:hypothetical protein
MRLVAFGCSLTYGHGLPDCWDPVAKEPKKKSSSFAWPEVVAKHLKAECVNTSFPGASNKEILFKIQNFNFQLGDIAIILWTFPERSCVIQSTDAYAPDTFKRLIPSNDDTDSKSFYMSYDDVDATIDFYTRIEYANLYFKSRDIKALHFLISDRMLSNFSWATAKLESVYIGDIKVNFPPALDNEHPGKLAHYKFAEEVITILNNTSVVDS